MKLNLYLFLSGGLLLSSMLSSCHSHSKGEDHDHEAETTAEKEEGHHHDGAITLSVRQAKEFGVETTEVEPAPFSEVIKVSGRIEPSASGKVTVTARRSGIVTLASGITPGADVKAGAAIATISSKGIQGGDPNREAVIRRDAALKELERLRPLHNDGLVTTATLNEAERIYNEASAAVGATPGSGTETTSAGGCITALFVSSGDYVETGAPIATISRNTRLTLRADVPERFAAMIPGIRTANFRPDCASETISLESLDGSLLAPGAINPAESGYIPLYFTFSSSSATPPGAFAEIYLIGAKRGNVISIPQNALIEMQGNNYVYVRLKGHDDAYEKRLVKIGSSDGVNVEIIEGLEPGELVVSKGATIVRMAETSAIAPPGHTHNH